MNPAEEFFSIFQGNDAAHYTWTPGAYLAEDRGICLEDIERHLRGTLRTVTRRMRHDPVLAIGICMSKNLGGIMNKFDQLLQETATERRDRREQLAALRASPVKLEATCPTCHELSGHLELEDQLMGYCAVHKVMWNAGYCKGHDLAEQRAKWAEVGAEDFQLVGGWFVGMVGTPHAGEKLADVLKGR